jgi:polysaccharide biosynthesis/export protein
MYRIILSVFTLTTVLLTAHASHAAEDGVAYPHEIPLLQQVRAANPQFAAAPVATPAVAGSTYKLQAGDMLRINVWKEEELDREVLVMPDGTIDFPLIGTFSVVGQSTTDVQRTVTQKLLPFIPAASVTVMVKETRGNAVSVIGQVTKPGEVIMTRSMTVIQALSQAGGLTPYADDDDIVILRKSGGVEQSIDFDYSDIARGKNLETNITLLPGDVIVVPTQSLF